MRCDKCARGYSGIFPNCVPCHKCFALWDVIIKDLSNRTNKLLDRANAMKVTGVIGPYQKTINSVQEKLEEVQTIISQNPAAQPLKNIDNLFEEAERLKSEVLEKVTEVEEKLAEISLNGSDKLAALQADADGVSKALKELGEQLEYMKISNVRGAMDSINKYFQMSLEAEEKVNASAVNLDSILEHSAATRREVEDLIDEKDTVFKQIQDEQSRILDELAGEIQNLDLSSVSEKTCGTPIGASCEDSQCGGLGCKTEDGKRKCGGEGCDGLVTVANNAWKRAMDFDSEILSAMTEVEELSKLVAESKLKAEEAKQNAQSVLNKANATREKVYKSNEDLRNLIKEIKDFLMQDGADLDSIEAVANEVLKMEMPTTPEQLHALTEDIRERVQSLSGVETILQQSAGDIARAESLLEEAKESSKSASDIKATADMVKEALEEAGKAQIAAEKAIKQADDDIKGTNNLLTSIESEAAASEETLNNATQRIANLEKSLGELLKMSAANSATLNSIEKSSEDAKANADGIKKVLDDELSNKYKKVEDLIAKKAEDSSEAKRKAEQLQNEAKALLSKANKKLNLLKDLEKSYEDNQRILEEKAKTLVALEEQVRTLLQTISQKAAVYSTCL